MLFVRRINEKNRALLQCGLLATMVALCCSVAASSSALPPVLAHSYAGISAGYGNFGYSNAYVEPGYHVNRFHNDQGSVNFLIGHYFNPYFSAQINLTRPVYWIQADIDQKSKPTIWTSVFSLALQPTYPPFRQNGCECGHWILVSQSSWHSQR